MTSDGDFHKDKLIRLLLKNANTIQLPLMDSNKTGGLISTKIIWSQSCYRSVHNRRQLLHVRWRDKMWRTAQKS